ncbi:polysaccharide pyruvyl transferase family protein [Mesorhizobium sp. M0633]|uniref:polysaccharide pyruvyl transferase family protein n=1 Tax=Mesorhizobium sp. M0633 TaxID=2956977 RepID=UPI00333B88E4
MLTIAVENSTWNNLGDAFYQTSLQRVLQKELPNHRVVSFDGPIKRAFRPGRFENNCFDVRSWTEADHYVFSGPILRGFTAHYGDLIKRIIEKGATYSLISVHSNAFDAEIPALRAFLAKYPPTAIHTRDHLTYEKIGDLVSPSLDGICFAFFVSRLDDIPTLSPNIPYICSSFHSMKEPRLTVNPTSKDTSFIGADVSFEVTKRRIPWKLERHADFRHTYQETLGPWKVIRPVHGLYPFPYLTFSRPNSYITYNPLNMLAIYKYCDGVVTDRVHAGVAALSFGRPARIVPVDTRFDLFSHAPIKRVGGVFQIDERALEREYERHSAWIRNQFLDSIPRV